MQPVLTTVIPTYRRPLLLRRAIFSALAQSEKNVLVHVFDNASGDETSSVVEHIMRYDARVKLTTNPHNVGGLANIARCVEEIHTPYFTVLCDDDLTLPGFYETGLRELGEHADAMMFAGATLILGASGELIAGNACTPERRLVEAPFAASLIASGHHPNFPAIIFRTKLLASVGGFDVEAGSLLDLDYYLRIAIGHSIIFCPEPCGILVDHEESWSNNPTAAHDEYDSLITRFESYCTDQTVARSVVRELGIRRDMRTLQIGLRALIHGSRSGIADLLASLERSGSTKTMNLLHALETIDAIVRIGPMLKWAIGFRLRVGRLSNALSGLLSGDRTPRNFRTHQAYFSKITTESRSNEYPSGC